MSSVTKTLEMAHEFGSFLWTWARYPGRVREMAKGSVKETTALVLLLFAFCYGLPFLIYDVTFFGPGFSVSPEDKTITAITFELLVLVLIASMALLYSILQSLLERIFRAERTAFAELYHFHFIQMAMVVLIWFIFLYIVLVVSAIGIIISQFIQFLFLAGLLGYAAFVNYTNFPRNPAVVTMWSALFVAWLSMYLWV